MSITLKQKKIECIYCSSEQVKKAIATGIDAIECPFCGYYELGKSKNKRKRKLTPFGYYKDALESVHNKIPFLTRIFKIKSVPLKKQYEILQILVMGFWDKYYEQNTIRGKSQFKERQSIDFNRLKETIKIIFINKGGCAHLPDDDKDLCLKIIDDGINLWKLSEKMNKEIYSSVNKKSNHRLKNNPKDLRAYTKLIKALVLSLNPLFIDKYRDDGKKKSLKKEATFQLVSDLLKCAFPQLQFTSEQIKARFYK